MEPNNFLKAENSQPGQGLLPVTKSSVLLSFLPDPSSGSYPEAVNSSPYSPTKAFFAWFQASVAKQLRTALFWFISFLPTFRDEFSFPPSGVKVFLTPEGGTDSLFQEVGMKLSLFPA